MGFIKAFGITLIAQIAILLSGVLNNIIIVRSLGPEGQGVYALIITTSVMLIVFGGSGLSAANTYWARKNKEDASAIFINSLFFAATISVIAFLLYAFFGKLILLKFFTPDLSLILIISLPLLLIQEFNQGILWGLERYDYHNFLNIFKAVMFVVANIVLLIAFKLDLKMAVLGWVVVIALTSIISVFILWREIGIQHFFLSCPFF